MNDRELIGSLLAGIVIALLLVYMPDVEGFCCGKAWGKCGISPNMSERRFGNLNT